MAHELNASICAAIPDEPKAMAAAIAKITSEWSAMIANLPSDGVQSSLSINETCAKPATNGARRTRRTAAQIAADKAALAAGAELGV
jgi:hypothetical protein